MIWVWAVLIGLIGGGLGGALGIGGGIVMIPLMVWLFGFSQREAQGTSLLVLALPVSVAGAIQYWRRDEAHLGHALAIAAGFVVGMYATAGYVGNIPNWALKKVFGVLLLFMGAKMIVDGALEKGGAVWPWLAGGAAVAAVGGLTRARRGGGRPPASARPEDPPPPKA